MIRKLEVNREKKIVEILKESKFREKERKEGKKIKEDKEKEKKDKDERKIVEGERKGRGKDEIIVNIKIEERNEREIRKGGDDDVIWLDLIKIEILRGKGKIEIEKDIEGEDVRGNIVIIEKELKEREIGIKGSVIVGKNISEIEIRSKLKEKSIERVKGLGKKLRRMKKRIGRNEENIKEGEKEGIEILKKRKIKEKMGRIDRGKIKEGESEDEKKIVRNWNIIIKYIMKVLERKVNKGKLFN